MTFEHILIQNHGINFNQPLHNSLSDSILFPFEEDKNKGVIAILELRGIEMVTLIHYSRSVCLRGHAFHSMQAIPVACYENVILIALKSLNSNIIKALCKQNISGISL